MDSHVNQLKIRIVYNQKGGVGKTTLATNLAACAAASGKRTLLVDSDPQGNSTTSLMGDAEVGDSLADFYESCLGIRLFGPPSLLQYVNATNIEKLYIVPCTRELEELRRKLEAKYKIQSLKKALENTNYEEVYLDPPPTWDFFSLSCLIAATEVIIPIDCDSFSIRSAQDLMAAIREVQMDHNPDLKVLGLVVNHYQKATKHGQKIIDELKGCHLDVIEPKIPYSVKVKESHSLAKPIVLSHPNHVVSQTIWELYHNLEQRSLSHNSTPTHSHPMSSSSLP